MKSHCITIDGASGEGGGQVLRASLSLSMALGRPFRMVNIRANRPKPGLKRQHLTCVKAAQTICRAKVEGDAINSTELFFAPGEVRPGQYAFHVGTGGSVTLVFQAVMPPLLWGKTPARLTVTGGTHVPYAPPFEFMRDTLFPRLEVLGPQLTAHMDHIGFMDTGGGSVTVDIRPAATATPFHQENPGEKKSGEGCRAEAVLYGQNLPEGVIERETAVLLSKKHAALGLAPADIRRLDGSKLSPAAAGSGNMVLLTVNDGLHKTVFGECGWRGHSAEVVAGQACKRALEYIRAGRPVEAHLTDQLLVPLALAGGGSFIAERVTRHTRTCLAVIRQFMDVRMDLAPAGAKGTRITLR